MRKELVYLKLKELSVERNKGITASEISQEISITRANASSDLNSLVIEGKAKKIKGRPTLFFPIEEANDKNKMIENYIKLNPSLKEAIEQAKAAILYPPNGMNILLLGETGVGKTTFARLIHNYSIELKIKPAGTPFITFNCADYANNPQLLLGQLFGVKKGAYTGAESDKEGLLEKADGGFLFLDEVHRLPVEGQEMFFTYMDTGRYRRLGETESERSVKVEIIAATTEDINSYLLKTFTRRIPMVINIPNLRDKGIDERFNLVDKFIKEEASLLGKSIKVSINSIKAFLSYECPGNIGQLKFDIQIACAKAYSEYISGKKDEIRINSLALPANIRSGLYKNIEYRNLWRKLPINSRYCIFQCQRNDSNLVKPYDNKSIYDIIDMRIHQFKDQGMKDLEFDKIIEKDIEKYFEDFSNKFYSGSNITLIENIIDRDILVVVEKVISFCEAEMGEIISKRIYCGLALHIASAIDRIKRHKSIENPNLLSIMKSHKREFSIALDALQIINSTLGINMPISEAGFLTMFLTYSEECSSDDNKVNILIIMHGDNVSQAMADSVNRMLACDFAIGIDAPLEEKPEVVLDRIVKTIRNNNICSDILLLVDMGSFTTFGNEVGKLLGLRTKTIPLVSTLHALEATRKAMMGASLDEIYNDTIDVNDIYQFSRIKEFKENKKAAIITMCSSGLGGAELVKSILTDRLSYDQDILIIISINYTNGEDTSKKIKILEKRYKVLCLIGPFALKTEYPLFLMDEVISGKAIDMIQRLINIERIYLNIGETLNTYLSNIDSYMVLKDVEQIIKDIEDGLKLKLQTSTIISFSIHVSIMIDKLLSGKKTTEYSNKTDFISKNKKLYKLIKNTFIPVSTKYNIVISTDDICYIMKYFDFM